MLQVRGVVLVTLALFLGIAALVLHFLAMCSPRWKTTKRDLPPAMSPVHYGLWERCEYTNMTIMKQGLPLGVRPDVQVCRPNRFMRYSANNFDACYNIRRNCPVVDPNDLPPGCRCRYLPSTKGLQWTTSLAAVCLIIGLLILYLRVITTANNGAATVLLNFGPCICFLLTLLLLVTTLILVGAYLRRDSYEDYTFPLKAVTDPLYIHGFDLHSLRNYAKSHAASFPHDHYVEAEKELRADANTHFHTNIGRATVYEVIATALIFVVTAITFLFGTTSREDNV